MAEGSAMAEMLDLVHDWTVDDLHNALAGIDGAADGDIDFRRFQIIDGALVVSPPPAPRHEIVTSRLIVAVSGAVPAGYEVVPTVGVDLGRSYLIPDLLVVPTARFTSTLAYLPPTDAMLVVEIVSPSSTTMDRVTKPAIYAAAGIGHYWRVETRPDVTITAYELDGSDHREAGSWGPGETLTLERPFPVEVSLDVLNRT